jgi:sarcosine oxidase subunit gamma
VTAIPQSQLDGVAEALAEATAACGGAVAIRELPFLAHTDVRLEPGARAAVERGLGIPLPQQPNTWVHGERSALWLGPDEWLLVTPPDSQAAVDAAVRAALADGWGAVVDVSDQRTILELSGPRARDVLAAGCSIDLHPRAFSPGRCAQTNLGRTGVVIAQHDAAPAYWVFVRRSFAGYLAAWLIDAIAEHRTT